MSLTGIIVPLVTPVAEDASHAKSRFLSNMSHAMRTPLTDIIGYAELLIEAQGEQDAAAIVQEAERIRHSGKQLLGMINSVLGTTPADALNGTTVLNTVALLSGAAVLRVHDVKEAAEAVRLVERLRR